MLNHLNFAEYDRLTRLAAMALCAVLALVGTVLLLQIVWGMQLRHDESVTLTTSNPLIATAPTGALSVSKWHLFGNAQSISAAQQLARNAPNTQLKLNLHGTLSLLDPKAGIAMIGDDKGAEHSYRVGEELPGGAKLDEVYTDHVIIVHEGAPETLALPRPEEHAAPPVAPGVPAISANPIVAKPGAASPSVAPVYQAPVMVTGAVDWQKARDQLAQNPADLMNRVKVVQENGKVVGAQLTNPSDAAMFAAAGLRPSDIITAVNGTAVSDLGGLTQLYANAKSGTQLQVSVQRDGKPATLTVTLK